MKFERIRVPGQAEIDLAKVVIPGADWHAAVS
jgi:2,5-furandicarboxylate decarboxylase 1